MNKRSLGCSYRKKGTAIMMTLMLITTTLMGCASQSATNVSALPTEEVEEKVTVETVKVQAGTNAAPSPATQVGQVANVNEEVVNVRIPGLSRNYKFLYASDLHIIAPGDSEVNNQSRDTVDARYNAFAMAGGMAPVQRWTTLPQTLNSYKADGILLGGDMVDYASAANVSALKSGVDQLNTRVMYVGADHDYASWYNGLDAGYIRQLYAAMAPNEAVKVWDYGQFLVVGIDNNTAQMSSAALATFKAAANRGLPIILLMHVPVKSLVDSSLTAASFAAWQGRDLTWGDGTYYTPNANTREFLNIIYGENSPVVEILSGHLHFSWDGMVTNTVHEHVFSPAYAGYVGVINVIGA